MYIVIHGRLRVTVELSNGKPNVVGEVSRGELVGEMSVFMDEPRMELVFSLRNTELVRFPKICFAILSKKHPYLLMRIIKILVNRLKRSNEALSDVPRSNNFDVIPVHPDMPVSRFATRLADQLSVYGSTLHLSTSMINDLLASGGISKTLEDDSRNIRLVDWLNAQENSYTYIVYDADKDFSAWSRRCYGSSDQVLLVADADQAPGRTGMEIWMPVPEKNRFIGS
jgi:CRP-like cAMP-binding protein